MGFEVKLIRVKDLSVGYDKKVVLKNLDLEIPWGKLTCLLGPNGSGKSTLIRSLATIQKPLGGSVSIEERNIQEIPKKELATKLSLVLTSSLVPGNMTVYSLVSTGRFPYTGLLGKLSQKDEEVVKEALELAGALQFADRHVGELSDGERQKVMIARALAQDTPIIFLDEPTAHLDPPNRLEIFNLLERLSSEHQKTILVSTHEIDLALTHADRLWLVSDKQTIQAGLPEDLVLNGALENAFGNRSLTFNYDKGRFEKEAARASISGLQLLGDQVLLTWTAQAIHKYISTDKDFQGVTIEVSGGLTEPLWKIAQEEKHFRNIEQLINYLEQHEH